MIHPTAWALILTDWKNERADVVVTLRSGAQFSGKVKRVDADGSLGDELTLESNVDAPGPYAGTRLKHRLITIDLAEVAAVEATAK